MNPLKPFATGSYAEISALPNPENLVIQCVPALVAILLSVERKAGSPLTKGQVEAIRDKTSVVAVPEEAAKAVDERRGYADINLSNAWEEWEVARRP